MKNLVKYTLFALVAVTLTGCIASDFEDGTLCRDGVLTFDLSTGDTRNGTPNDGVGDGTNDDRPTTESVIKDIQFFLYKRSADDTPSSDGDDAIFAGKITGISAASPDHDTYTTPQKSITIPAQTITQLFENASKCDIYVIVNYLDNTKDAEHLDGIDLTTDLTKTSRQKLKSLPLTFKFSGNLLANSSFVMDSELMTVSRGTGSDINKLKADDIIYVTRAAAKILIEVNVENSITVNGETWQPYIQSENESDNDKIMTLSFFNGVKYGIIDDDSDDKPAGKDIPPAFTAEGYDPYYKIENMLMTQAGVDAGITNPNTSAVTRATTSFTPMSSLYTYTSLWDDEDSDVPYFMLTIPWRKASDSSATWVNYEYKIPISKTNQFVRNKLYLIRLTVGALGDLNLLDKSVLEFNVLDWKSEDVNVSLDNPRYLVVNEHSYEMDNVEEILIPYSSSHECVITDLTVKRDDLYAGTEASQNDKNSTHNAELVTIDGKTYIKVYNDLDNNLFVNNVYNSNFDIEKYTITLTISHKNADGSANSTYTENIKIIQYPAFFGVAQLNSNAYKEEGKQNDMNGFVWVNGYQGTWDDSSGLENFDNCEGLTGNSVTAQSMYVFNISSLAGTDYILGDPRKREVDNLDDYNFDLATGYSTYTGQNREGLQYYYPTDAKLSDGESSPSYNMVAPKFRLSSGYGQIDTNGARRSYSVAVGRCATYQEDGYPAGRWRLPTAAEFRLIYTLVQKGVIPTVYQISSSLHYWCAHGHGILSGNQVNIYNEDSYSSVSIRCVYDDWYWGSEPVNDNRNNPDGDRFTWGDEPRPTATAK